MTEHNVTRIMRNGRRAPLPLVRTDFQELLVSQERYFEGMIGSVVWRFVSFFVLIVM